MPQTTHIVTMTHPSSDSVLVRSCHRIEAAAEKAAKKCHGRALRVIQLADGPSREPRSGDRLEVYSEAGVDFALRPPRAESKPAYQTALFVKCTHEQTGRWRAAAERDHRGLSSWVRLTLDRAAGE